MPKGQARAKRDARWLFAALHKEARNMANLDLDALRAEADMTPHEVTLGGKTYRLRARMPLEFTDHLVAGNLVDAVKLLLLDPTEWDQLREALPDDQDLLAICELYNVAAGESQASAPSSRNGGQSSRPTSPATTSSTSAKSASARRRSARGGSTS